MRRIRLEARLATTRTYYAHRGRKSRGHDYRRSYGGEVPCRTPGFQMGPRDGSLVLACGYAELPECSRAAISALTTATCAWSSFKLISGLRSKSGIIPSTQCNRILAAAKRTCGLSAFNLCLTAESSCILLASFRAVSSVSISCMRHYPEQYLINATASAESSSMTWARPYSSSSKRVTLARG